MGVGATSVGKGDVSVVYEYVFHCWLSEIILFLVVFIIKLEINININV